MLDQDATVEAVGSGEEAVRVCNAKRVLLILIDVHLPGISGCETALRIRRHEQDHNLPRSYVVGMSTDFTDPSFWGSIYSLAKAAGMDDLLPKPISPSRAACALRRCGLATRENLESGGNEYTEIYRRVLDVQGSILTPPAPGTTQPEEVEGEATDGEMADGEAASSQELRASLDEFPYIASPVSMSPVGRGLEQLPC
eukprot:NODE_2176_length_971_cov_131.994577_g1789_i0.p1 GENE.NODE_2176_length_971_cov_131.994577_g1789_i0~~NODE_2176_length_971_cov_131.994577_g1789_i0.p1  ORF type:complete len:198 (-),score=51.48 NODE_2176_length_971_cov_131.994577_g1789_i0:143-736(-)